MNRYFMSHRIMLVALLVLFPLAGFAQNQGPAVTHWRSFLPYNQANDLATDGERIFCGTDGGFFFYDTQDGSLEAYSKARGMHDVSVDALAYDAATGYVILAYDNSNVDLFRDNVFYNIPEIKSAQVGGDKTIHSVTARDGYAYLSSGMGLVVVDISRKEIAETVVFYDSSIAAQVYDAVLIGNDLVAATSVGVFKTPIDNPFIQNYATWELFSPRSFRFLSTHQSKLYLATTDSVFVANPQGQLTAIGATEEVISNLNPGKTGVWVSRITDGNGKGNGYLLNDAGAILDSIPCRTPSCILQMPDGSVWYTDRSTYGYPQDFGLRKKISASESEPYFPDGPVVASSFDVDAYGGAFWVAHGGYDQVWNGLFQRSMLSHFENGHWTHYPWLSDNEWVQDIVRVCTDRNTGTVYAASYSGGLVVLPPDGSIRVYDSAYLPSYISNPGLCRLSGIAIDHSGNVWVTNNGAATEMSVLTPDGVWYHSLSIPGNTSPPPHSAADVIIDDLGQKWFVTTSGNGVIVYDDKETLHTTSDDEYRILRKGEGNGNLPDNRAISIVKDRDGAIWIGTANGIAIVNCPAEVISGGCEATLKVVQFDEFADYLFVNQSVNALAVDGANRKWVGTANGVWLISEDGEKVIYRFSEDNSPLPSNQIRRINIDPVTGDVYISTSKGLVSFRSTATEGKEAIEDPLLVYPNPVPPGFSGMIAVRGLTENADVRITDISGQLVYRTKAFGGQAVWNGRDYTGHKVQSGVYLVYVVSKDGTKKATGKFIIQN